MHKAYQYSAWRTKAIMVGNCTIVVMVDGYIALSILVGKLVF